MIKNVFLDAGGVILDETVFEEVSAKIITEIIRNTNSKYSIENYWKDIAESVYRFVPRAYDYVLYKNINSIDDFQKAKTQYKNKLKDENVKLELMEGIRDFLPEFSKHFSIGILGQYGIDFRDHLENEKLLQYFTYTEIQDDYDITKPDPRYFIAILEKCGCRAEESVMIGDRVDKDVIPAKMTGMKTIRVRSGIYKTQEPRVPAEIPDLTVERINEIKVDAIKLMVGHL